METDLLKLPSENRARVVQQLNLREIARRARVSTATVSRTINRVPTVNRYLARRVWKVVEAAGYYPNTQARALVSGHSRILGLVVPELTNPVFAEILQTFEDVAAQHGYQILFSSIKGDSCRMEQVGRRMIERRVDGVAALTCDVEEPVIQDLLLHGISVVSMNGTPIPGATNIRIDYQNGMRQAIEHLAALRHQRIAFVAGPEHLAWQQVRKEIFQEAMAEVGLETSPEHIITGDNSVESGMRALRELWLLPARPTAILCANDLMATGALVQAYECKITVPAQLSVVGFDDIRSAQFTTPPLTTVRISQADLVMRAFQMLTDHDNTFNSSDEYVVKTSLVLRRSTALQPRVQSAG